MNKDSIKSLIYELDCIDRSVEEIRYEINSYKKSSIDSNIEDIIENSRFDSSNLSDIMLFEEIMNNWEEFKTNKDKILKSKELFSEIKDYVIYNRCECENTDIDSDYIIDLCEDGENI